MPQTIEKPKPQELDLETLQDVIDRMIKYGEQFQLELAMLNRKYPVQYHIEDHARVYPEPLKTILK